MFDFFKKEKPFQGFQGFGGGASGLAMFSGKAEITGGTKSTARSGYTVHTFTSSGSLVAPDGIPGSLTAEVLVVGGGGGGAAGDSGGGGDGFGDGWLFVGWWGLGPTRGTNVVGNHP